MRTELRQHFVELVFYRSLAELRAEAARAYLGVLWWVLEPLLYLVVFYSVFGLLFDRGSGSYPGGQHVSFLLSGLVAWRWFQNTVMRGTTAIGVHSALISQVYLPKFILPSVVLVTNLLKFSVVLVLLLVFLATLGPGVKLTWLALPVVLAVQLLLIAACTWLAAAVVPFFPDLRLVAENGLILLLFLSGIFYDVKAFAPTTQLYFRLNPVATVIEAWRDTLLAGHWPHWMALASVTGASLLGLLGAGYLLVRFDRVYPKIVIE